MLNTANPVSSLETVTYSSGLDENGIVYYINTPDGELTLYTEAFSLFCSLMAQLEKNLVRIDY